jgi:hypothetical protein
VRQQQQTTAGILGQPGGTLLIGGVGVIVVGIGAFVAWYGVSRGFEKRLQRGRMRRRTRQLAVLTGQVGYAVKGSAYAVVGVLLVVAAVTFDPRRSTGLDGALRTLAAQPLGTTLLVAVAFGFAVFGVYCFFQSRYRRV